VRGKNHQAYLCQYSRPGGVVVFDFRMGREREGPKRFLGKFDGILQSDGYAGFSKPEVQISLPNSFNQTVNALSITIAPAEIREIETVAEPVRASVREMFERYKPSQGKGEE